jgi:hypothetical protein
MSIMFRIATAADHGENPTATITPAQLAAFRALLRDTGARLGQMLLEPDDHDEQDSCALEARVCPLALASMARVFDYDPDVIAVLEEAQFRVRRVSIWSFTLQPEIRMSVSITSDQGVELDLANSNAYALLESLGLEPESVGELPVDLVRQRLDDPTVKRRMAHYQVDRYTDRLKQLLATADQDESSRFEWA